MKKILLVLFIPSMFFGQLMPIDDNVKSSNFEKYLSLLAESKNSFGFLSNPNSCPFGLSYVNFDLIKLFGIYVEYKTDFDVLAPGEWALREKDFIINDINALPTGNSKEGAYNVLNFGILSPIIDNPKTITILYFGIGTSKLKLFDEYSSEYTGLYYTREGEIKKRNVNFGLLFQRKNNPFTFQLGYDSKVNKNIYLGLGLKFAGRS